MAKNNQSEEKYKHALGHVRDSLQHHETVDVMIKVLSKRSDFHSMIFKALCSYTGFWVILVLTGFGTAIFALNFPDLAKWLISLAAPK